MRWAGQDGRDGMRVTVCVQWGRIGGDKSADRRTKMPARFPG